MNFFKGVALNFNGFIQDPCYVSETNTSINRCVFIYRFVLDGEKLSPHLREHTPRTELTPRTCRTQAREPRRAEFPRSDGCGVTVPAPPAGDRPGRDADRSESLRCENATVLPSRARAARTAARRSRGDHRTATGRRPGVIREPPVRAAARPARDGTCSVRRRSRTRAPRAAGAAGALPARADDRVGRGEP